MAVGTFYTANIFIQVGDFEHCMCSKVWNMITVWLDPVRGPLTIDKIELFRYWLTHLVSGQLEIVSCIVRIAHVVKGVFFPSLRILCDEDGIAVRVLYMS